MNTHVTVSGMRQDLSKIIQGEIGIQVHSVSATCIRSMRILTVAQPRNILGELPPPPPSACFGRDELIERIVGLAENFTSMALIGPGGIGKTSVALAVLHHDRIKKRFGESRRFLRCDKFPPSPTHLLSQLSKVVGAAVENPESLTPLRPFFSSAEMILFLDNAESILDPQGTNAQEIYAVVEELSRFDNICLCLTSRISTIPPACETLDIPTLSIEAARDTFYRIYKNGGQSNPVDGILRQLDFHPLSITLLATVAHHNKWDVDRLTREWGGRRTDMLRTRHNDSLATTIELSLASPMFQDLGPDAREVLGVVAFFPQGVDENNIDWLFSTFPNRTNIFDNFSVLSLTYRSNGFVTMLAPLRDYLCPRDPASSPLLNIIKGYYFSRLSVFVDPGKPGFEDARWIISEDVNVEHLLDIFTSAEADSTDVWSACGHFMEHLHWHKGRLVVLGPKIESLPDDHPRKPECLVQLSRLFDSVGNEAESKRLLTHSLKLWKERGDDFQIAVTLRLLSSADRSLGLHKDGIRWATEALEIYERLNHTGGQAKTWQWLARLLYDDKQLGAAEVAALRAINLLSDEDDQFPVCECYRTLGNIYRSKGQNKDAIGHFETALGIASRANWHCSLFWIHYSLAELFSGENKFDDAHSHIERARSYAFNNPYQLGRAMELRARFWCRQRRFGEAKSEALGAISAYEQIGAAKDVEDCRGILREVGEAMDKPAASR